MPIIRRKKTGGRKRDEILYAFAEKYRLTVKQRVLLSHCLVQFCLCETEEARRLLLGISK